MDMGPYPPLLGNPLNPPVEYTPSRPPPPVIPNYNRPVDPNSTTTYRYTAGIYLKILITKITYLMICQLKKWKESEKRKEIKNHFYC